MLLVYLIGLVLIGFLIHQLAEFMEVRNTVEADLRDAIRDYRPGLKFLSERDRLVEKIAEKQAKGEPVNLRIDGAEQGNNKLLSPWLGRLFKVRVPVLGPDLIQRVLDSKKPASVRQSEFAALSVLARIESRHRIGPYSTLSPSPPDDRTRGIERRDDMPIPDPDHPRFTNSFPPTDRRSSGTSIEAPTRGLVIGEEPLERILSGRKTMELRSSHNRQLGPVALIRKGSGRIFGVATITSSDGPMSFKRFVSAVAKHGVPKHRLQEVFDKNRRIGWNLDKIWRLQEPVAYNHRGMSRVTLDPDVVLALHQELQRAALVKFSVTPEDVEAYREVMEFYDQITSSRT